MSKNKKDYKALFDPQVRADTQKNQEQKKTYLDKEQQETVSRMEAKLFGHLKNCGIVSVAKDYK